MSLTKELPPHSNNYDVFDQLKQKEDQIKILLERLNKDHNLSNIDFVSENKKLHKDVFELQKTCAQLEVENYKLKLEFAKISENLHQTVTELNSHKEKLQNEFDAINDARMVVIKAQEKAIKAYRMSNLKEVIKVIFQPRIGVLYHHKPISLKIPKKYNKNSRLKQYPSISIVTPSRNHERYIERTILSVLNQDYPNLEYIVQDGNSDDSTSEIMKDYIHALKNYESIDDDGQTHALNLGFRHASGEIMAYLNSDDLLLEGSLHYVAKYFNNNPDVDVIYGHRVLIDEYDQEVGRWVLPPHDNKILSWADYVPQETLFWRRRIWDKVGASFDENFRFAMDWDLLLRFREAGAKFARLPRFLGAFRIHPHQKTSSVLQEIGAEEMYKLRFRCNSRHVSHEDIKTNIRSYMNRHLLYHKLYRLGILRY